MYTYKPADLLAKQQSAPRKESGIEALYIGHLRREVHAAGVDGATRNPLANYFDHISMVS